jgi:two-component system, OmpR family, catabolic regulation response regulator CreB
VNGAAILLLEDDPAIARTVVFALEREGAQVTHCLLVREALQRMEHDPPQLAIFDIGLPDGSGLDALRTLRENRAMALLPVLMLSARGEEFDRVLGLELGADDYLPKPFSPRELVARVRALLRRATSQTLRPSSREPSRFEHDRSGQRVRFAGVWLDLTRLEYGLLARLLDAPGRIQSREALLDAVWGGQADSGDRTVDTHIKTLRAKLRAIDEVECIVTHRGMGYTIKTE